MMKMILSSSEEMAVLKSRIARLTARKARMDREYQLEMERLEAKVQELQPPVEEPEAPKDDLPDGLPSFMRPTLVSSIRTAQSQSAHQEDKHRQARMPKKPEPYPPNWEWDNCPPYAKSTLAANRRVKKLAPIRYLTPPDTPDSILKDTSPSTTDPGFGGKDSAVPDTPPETPIDDEGPEMVYYAMFLALSEKTKLGDSQSSTSGYPSDLYISGDLSFRLLGEGLELARQGFWNFCRQHVRGLWCSRYQMGPHSVKFGYTEMQLAGVEWRVQPVDPLGKIRSALNSLPNIRNTYCHFEGDFSTGYLGECLRNIQVLLVALGDEERARQARELRDQLEQAAKQCEAEINTIGLLSSLPYHDGLDWTPHHEHLFAFHQRNYGFSNRAMQQALDTWFERRCAPGKDREGFGVDNGSKEEI